MIECITLYGKKKLVPKNKLIFRIAAYSIMVDNDKILLMNTKRTGKYFFPGGGVELGESVEDALERETKEETGLDIEIKRFFKLIETFFYYDPMDEAYHNFSLFFICKPKTLNLLDDSQVQDDEAEKPRWIDIKKLKMNNFQTPSEKIFHLLKKQQII